MKNKKNTYILLVIVLLVWGAFLYQVLSIVNTDEIISQDKNQYRIKPLKIKERKIFIINVNYRDPFLGKMYVINNNSSVKTKTSKVKKFAKPKEKLVWPAIFYKGMISDSNNKKKIFIIIIDGKNHYMRIGDTQDEIFLKSGDKESLYIRYKGNLNLIMLQD